MMCRRWGIGQVDWEKGSWRKSKTTAQMESRLWVRVTSVKFPFSVNE